jgi:hypothetical protein
MKQNNTQKRNSHNKKTMSLKAANQSQIQQVIDYGRSLKGVKRWKGNFNKYIPESDTAPMYVVLKDNRTKQLPTKAEIKKKGLICCGLINLMRRKAGFGIPYYPLDKKTYEQTGDTGGWFYALSSLKRLESFDFRKSYPIGTLLLRKYNPEDEGHMAVITSENEKGVLFSSLLHSHWVKGVVEDAATGTSYFSQYNGKSNVGHYTHVCYPENWLLKE